MKESVLDVLMYLFEHYLDDDEVDVDSDRESLHQELSKAGFPQQEIQKAFAWLEGLTTSGEVSSAGRNGTPSLRVYSADEGERLDAEVSCCFWSRSVSSKLTLASWSSIGSWRWSANT